MLSGRICYLYIQGFHSGWEFGNNGELDFSPGIDWDFFFFLHAVFKNPHKNVSARKMTRDIIQTFRKKGQSGHFTYEKSWEPCNFGWEMAGDEDMESWEMAWDEGMESWEMVGMRVWKVGKWLGMKVWKVGKWLWGYGKLGNVWGFAGVGTLSIAVCNSRLQHLLWQVIILYVRCQFN